MNNTEVATDDKVKIKSYTIIEDDGMRLTFEFTDDEELDKKTREIIKDFIVREIL